MYIRTRTACTSCSLLMSQIVASPYINISCHKHPRLCKNHTENSQTNSRFGSLPVARVLEKRETQAGNSPNPLVTISCMHYAYAIKSHLPVRVQYLCMHYAIKSHCLFCSLSHTNMAWRMRLKLPTCTCKYNLTMPNNILSLKLTGISSNLGSRMKRIHKGVTVVSPVGMQ